MILVELKHFFTIHKPITALNTKVPCNFEFPLLENVILSIKHMPKINFMLITHKKYLFPEVFELKNGFYYKIIHFI